MGRDGSTEQHPDRSRPGLLRRMARDEAPLQGFLGEGTELSGNLKLEGSFRVDGTLKGEVRSTSMLIIGVPGRVEVQTLEAEELQIGGRVRGTVHVHRRLEIFPGGVLEGELTLDGPALVVARGGVIRGSVHMRQGRPRESTADGDAISPPAERRADAASQPESEGR